jgi:glutamine synthetase
MDIIPKNKMTNKTILEYIWIDAKHQFRSKVMVEYTLRDTLPDIADIKSWNYDGSSTGQSDGHCNTEIVIKPVFVCVNPFHDGNFIKTAYSYPSYYVLCDTYTINGDPTPSNYRYDAIAMFNSNKDMANSIWYGIEQEYFIYNNDTDKPLGFSSSCNGLYMKPQGDYYCRMGNEFGRKIAYEHLNKCILSNLYISGLNAEVAPGQWEYQIGPCSGINAADNLMMSRFILERVADMHRCYIKWHPKPLSKKYGYHGEWNGSGCHVNVSTKEMREGGSDGNGLHYIMDAVYKLEKKHAEHMKLYGEGNEERMTGVCETSSIDTFSWGIGTRNTSIRISNDVFKVGYFEDRRPASNMDPYLVTSTLFNTIIQ